MLPFSWFFGVSLVDCTPPNSKCGWENSNPSFRERKSQAILLNRLFFLSFGCRYSSDTSKNLKRYKILQKIDILRAFFRFSRHDLVDVVINLMYINLWLDSNDVVDALWERRTVCKKLFVTNRSPQLEIGYLQMHMTCNVSIHSAVRCGFDKNSELYSVHGNGKSMQYYVLAEKRRTCDISRIPTLF